MIGFRNCRSILFNAQAVLLDSCSILFDSRYHVGQHSIQPVHDFILRTAQGILLQSHSLESGVGHTHSALGSFHSGLNRTLGYHIFAVMKVVLSKERQRSGNSIAL